VKFQLHHRSSLTSTNDELMRRAKEGADEGTVVMTDHQTKGRGRGSNVWVSESGKDILMSLLLRPQCDASQVSGLTLVAARAIQNFLESKGLTSSIKPPNDVLVEGKKISGILTESQTTGSRVDWCIVGIGLNVNSEASDLPEGATSLQLETGDFFSVKDLGNELLAELAREYEEYN